MSEELPWTIDISNANFPIAEVPLEQALELFERIQKTDNEWFEQAKEFAAYNDELYLENARLSERGKEQRRVISNLKNDVERLRKALEVYGDKKRWEHVNEDCYSCDDWHFDWPSKDSEISEARKKMSTLYNGKPWLIAQEALETERNEVDDDG